jgi:hypothetical protein
MPTIESIDKSSAKTITAKTRADADPKVRHYRWWTQSDPKELAESLFAVVKYLKENQNWRQHQSALYARLYSNLPIWNYLGINLSKMNVQYRFPNERPTMNVVQSCIDALVSRMTQSKPKPMFLTQGGDYTKRKLSKDLNRFTEGEFYQLKAYQYGEQVLRDSIILGDGIFKILEDTSSKKVAIERTLCTELFVDEQDGMYGFPRQMHQLKVVDRDVLAELYPKYESSIMKAQPAYIDSSTQSENTVSSQIMLCESWHLKSGENAKDGRHVIAIDNDIIFDEQEWMDDDFPFVRLQYSPRTLGFWAQGLPEQLMGLQNEVNRLLYTIQMSLHLCGIPKWLIEDGSKVVSSHINNQIGGIIKFQGTAPVLQVAQCVPAELYQQLERLIQYAYQQSGISSMAAASQKPAGLNSGAALREYDDLQSDRFAYLSQRYENFYIELAKKVFNQAKKIAERDGAYETVYPGKEGLLKIEFPKGKLEDDDFVIQVFPTSALSKNPAERKQEIIDLMQGGLIQPDEGRRLLDYPDLQQEEDLLNAPEERILKVLDDMVENGKYTPPDPYMDLQKAKVLCLQYYNKYTKDKLPSNKTMMLEQFNTQIEEMQQMAQAQMQAQAASQVAPMGQPQAPPQPMQPSPMVPNVPQAGAA